MTNPGINYVTTEITKLVKTGQYLGMINAGLTQRQVWSKGAEWEPAPIREGDDFKIDESEPAKPKQKPSVPVNRDSTTITDILFSGETKKDQKHGYYYMFMNMWRDLTSASVNELAMTFKDTMKEKMRWIADSAGLTRDLQARRTLSQAYNGGRTWATENKTSSATSFTIKDVNGFIEVVESGVPFPVSVSHPLEVTIINGTLGTITRNVTGCTYSDDDLVEADDTIPGTLTISVAVSEIDIGDPIVSSQASVSVRPGGKTTAYNLEATDKLTFSMVTRIGATMKDFNISPHEDGLYHFIGDSDHFVDLWADSTFANAYQGQYNSKEWREGNAITVGGILFDFSNQPANSENPAGVLVKRFLVTGQGHLKQGYYKDDPKETYTDISSSPSHRFVYDAENRVRHILQLPQGVFADVVHMAWEAYWGWAPRQDSLATFGKKPLARYKRAVAGQTG